MNVLHWEEKRWWRKTEREGEWKKEQNSSWAKSLSIPTPKPYNARLTLPFQRLDTTSSGKLLLLRWYSWSLKCRVVFFFSFAVLFHYHQSELLHFPVSHFVGNYRGGRVAAVAAKRRREQPRCQVRWSASEKEWVQAGWVGHRRRAYGGHCQLSSGKRANIHSTAGTVTQIKEDCTNTPRQAIIHCVSTSFLSLMSFAHSKSSLIIGAIFSDPFWVTIVAFFVRLCHPQDKAQWKFTGRK